MNNNLSMILGERLLKISFVAKETGISRTTLTNLYYKRSKSISGRVLNKLCAYLNITPDILLSNCRETEGEKNDITTNENN